MNYNFSISGGFSNLHLPPLLRTEYGVENPNNLLTVIEISVLNNIALEDYLIGCKTRGKHM